MPDNVLVALDGSSLSERALIYALDTFPDASITTIFVINPIDAVIDAEASGLPAASDWHENAKTHAKSIHRTAEDLAAERNTDLIIATEVGNPARTILEYTGDNTVDQIVMGSHGRSGLDRALLGSVAERVTRRARIPVTVVA